MPDDLAQQLGAFANGGEGSLQKIVLHTLTTLAELMRSLPVIQGSVKHQQKEIEKNLVGTQNAPAN